MRPPRVWGGRMAQVVDKLADKDKSCKARHKTEQNEGVYREVNDQVLEILETQQGATAPFARLCLCLRGGGETPPPLRFYNSFI